MNFALLFRDRCACGVLVLWLLLSAGGHGAVKLAAIFGDQMVLQRRKPVVIWGTAEAGELVKVTLAGKTEAVKAGDDGRWQARLTEAEAGGPFELTVQGSSIERRTGVYFGDVWLFSGSPEAFSTVRTLKVEIPIMAPTVRVFRIPYRVATAEMSDGEGSWQNAAESKAVELPLLVLEFARRLSANVPIGILCAISEVRSQFLPASFFAGDLVEAWVPESACLDLDFYPALKKYHSGANLKNREGAFSEQFAQWAAKHQAAGAPKEEKEYDVWYYERQAQATAGGSEEPFLMPRKPSAENIQGLGSVWNGMVAPVSRYGLSGVVYAPGIGNLGNPITVGPLMERLVTSWRKCWNDSKLPIFCLGLGEANIPLDTQPAWIALVDAFRPMATGPSTALVSFDGLCARRSLQPDALKLAERLSAAASGLSSGQMRARWSGPVITNAQFHGNQVTVSLAPGADLPAGLKEVQGFALYSKSTHWVYAVGKIENGELKVSHPMVSAPTALRYDWINDGAHAGSLISQAGLRALSFRTDNDYFMPGTVPIPHLEWASNSQPAPPLHRGLPIDVWPVEDPTLPRVITVGDSIHSGYKDLLKKKLAGRANVVSIVTPVNVKMALAMKRPVFEIHPGEYALLHINHGLHGDASVPEAEFVSQLSAYFDLLRTSMGNGKIIWATTTPIPSKTEGEILDPAKNAGILRINEVAKRLAPSRKILINDFYPLLADRMDKLSENRGNVHVGSAGREILAEAAAKSILRALKLD